MKERDRITRITQIHKQTKRNIPIKFNLYIVWITLLHKKHAVIFFIQIKYTQIYTTDIQLK